MFNFIRATLVGGLLMMASQTNAVSLCTPATINAATIAEIKPYLQLPAVNKLLACSPDDLVLNPFGGWGAVFSVPVTHEEIEVFFDPMGVVGALYFNPITKSTVLGFRQLSPPMPTNWQVSAGH